MWRRNAFVYSHYRFELFLLSRKRRSAHKSSVTISLLPDESLSRFDLPEHTSNGLSQKTYWQTIPNTLASVDDLMMVIPHPTRFFIKSVAALWRISGLFWIFVSVKWRVDAPTDPIVLLGASLSWTVVQKLKFYRRKAVILKCASAKLAHLRFLLQLPITFDIGHLAYCGSKTFIEEWRQ